MSNYRITYSKGYIIVKVQATEEGLQAKLSEENSTNSITIIGKDQSQIFDNCLIWASTNISGEFCLEAAEQ